MIGMIGMIDMTGMIAGPLLEITIPQAETTIDAHRQEVATTIGMLITTGGAVEAAEATGMQCSCWGAIFDNSSRLGMCANRW
jgi:hypothetical protein